MTKSANTTISKSLHAVAIYDIYEEKGTEDFELFKFYTLTGKCKKCGVGDYALIIYDFKENNKDHGQSIFRTRCLCCDVKSIYYQKDVIL